MIIQFSKFRLFFFIFSAVLTVLMALYTWLVHGFAKSITFNGGIRLSLSLPEGMTRDDLIRISEQLGYEDPTVRLTSVRTNQYDLEYGPSVRDRLEKKIKERDQSRSADAAGGGSEEDAEYGTAAYEIEMELIKAVPGLTKDSFSSRETISASYGGDLFSISTWSFVFTILIIGLYLSFRFDFPFAMGASLALIHDVVLTIAFIGVMQIEPSIPVVAAVLTIVGYSINDTIVIFDRIRDNMDDQPMLAATKSTMDAAITETLSRTLITSALTLVSVVALLLGGAESLYDFAYILIFGIVIGTYSSIFIASHFVQVYAELMGRILKRNA